MFNKLPFVALCLGLMVFSSCQKDTTDTSGGEIINPVRALEVHIDGSEWDTDEVHMETLYKSLYIEAVEGNRLMRFAIDDFNGPANYMINNGSSYVRYYPSATDLTDYYYASNDTVTISEFPSTEPFCLGNFSFTGIHSLGGASKEFTLGTFNGIDSLSPVPNDIFSIMLNNETWTPKSLEVIQNDATQKITVLAQSANDNTYVVIRIPLTTGAGTYALNDPNFTVEYQEVDGNTYTANSGDLNITENDFFNSSLIGTFDDLTLTNSSTGTSVNLAGNFNMQYD